MLCFMLAFKIGSNDLTLPHCLYRFWWMTFRNASADLFSFFYIIYIQKILMHFKIKLLRKLSLVGLTCITCLQWNHEVTIRNSPKILIKEIKDIGQKNSFFLKELYFGMLHQNCLKIESGVSWHYIRKGVHIKVNHVYLVSYLIVRQLL